jgi:hypothetical protein
VPLGRSFAAGRLARPNRRSRSDRIMASAEPEGRKPVSDRLDIGEVAALRVDVISETGWFDDVRFKQDMADYGGSDQTQYAIAWDRENAGGYAALLTITQLDGDEKKILLDTGWNTDWMDEAFARQGIDQMLARRDRRHGAVALAPRSLLGDRVDAQA